MIYIIIFIITLLILLLFVYPFKIQIFNDDKYLFIKVGMLITLKLNLYALLDESNSLELKKQAKGIKVIKKLRFKEIDLYIRGFNYNYLVNGSYYGITCALLPIIQNILDYNEIKFNYLVDYNGELYIKFKSIVRSNFFCLIKGFYGI